MLIAHTYRAEKPQWTGWRRAPRLHSHKIRQREASLQGSVKVCRGVGVCISVLERSHSQTSRKLFNSLIHCFVLLNAVASSHSLFHLFNHSSVSCGAQTCTTKQDLVLCFCTMNVVQFVEGYITMVTNAANLICLCSWLEINRYAITVYWSIKSPGNSVTVPGSSLEILCADNRKVFFLIPSNVSVIPRWGWVINTDSWMQFYSLTVNSHIASFSSCLQIGYASLK